MTQWKASISKKRKIQLAAIFLGICFLTGILLFLSAFSSGRTQKVGKLIPKDAVLAGRQQLFSRPNGGFLLVSMEDDQICTAFFHQDGSLVKQDSADLVKHWSYSSAHASVRGDVLYLTGFQYSNGIEASGILFVYPMETSALNWWDTCSHFFSNELFGLKIAGMTVGEDGRFYALGEGAVLSFFADEISDEEGPEALEHWYVQDQIPDMEPQQLAVSPDGMLYILGEREGRAALAVMDCNADSVLDSARILEKGDIPTFPLRFLDETLVVDQQGTLYRIHADWSLERQRHTLSSDAVCRLENGNWLVKSGQNLLQEYDPDDFSSPIKSYALDGEICALSDGDDPMVLLSTDQGYSLLPFSEAEDRPIDPPSEADPSQEGGGSSSEAATENSSIPEESSSEILSEPAVSTESSHENSGSSSFPDGIPDRIISSQFPLDEKRNILTVPAGTTVAGLKKTLQLGQAEMRVKKSTGAVVKSGKLATGMTVQLWYQGQELDTVTLVVAGDLTGTGTVTSRDVQLLYQYLLGKEQLKEPFFFAADFNGDQEVDNRDLVLVKKYILEN